MLNAAWNGAGLFHQPQAMGRICHRNLPAAALPKEHSIHSLTGFRMVLKLGF